MFLSSGQLQNDLAGRLKTTMDRLGNYWADFVTQCQEWAYQEIVGQLSARGFTADQIADWDRGAEFERAITLYWAFANAAAAGGGLDLKSIALLDRRPELAKVFVTVGGEPQIPPVSSTSTTVTVGAGSTSPVSTAPTTENIFNFKIGRDGLLEIGSIFDELGGGG